MRGRSICPKGVIVTLSHVTPLASLSCLGLVCRKLCGRYRNYIDINESGSCPCRAQLDHTLDCELHVLYPHLLANESNSILGSTKGISLAAFITASHAFG